MNDLSWAKRDERGRPDYEAGTVQRRVKVIEISDPQVRVSDLRKNMRTWMGLDKLAAWKRIT